MMPPQPEERGLLPLLWGDTDGDWLLGTPSGPPPASAHNECTFIHIHNMVSPHARPTCSACHHPRAGEERAGGLVNPFPSLRRRSIGRCGHLLPPSSPSPIMAWPNRHAQEKGGDDCSACHHRGLEWTRAKRLAGWGGDWLTGNIYGRTSPPSSSPTFPSSPQPTKVEDG